MLQRSGNSYKSRFLFNGGGEQGGEEGGGVNVPVVPVLMDKNAQLILVGFAANKSYAFGLHDKCCQFIERNGEYALLDENSIETFYKRNEDNNRWVYDPTVTTASFANNNKLFCEANKKCSKDEKTKNCYKAELTDRLDTYRCSMLSSTYTVPYVG